MGRGNFLELFIWLWGSLRKWNVGLLVKAPCAMEGGKTQGWCWIVCAILSYCHYVERWPESLEAQLSSIPSFLGSLFPHLIDK